MSQSSKKRTVIFDHDGGVDDLLSLMMLLAMPHIDLAGIIVTPADCFLRPAVSATQKILRFFGRSDVELSEGRLHGVNPFPRAWRGRRRNAPLSTSRDVGLGPKGGGGRVERAAGAFRGVAC